MNIKEYHSNGLAIIYDEDTLSSFSPLIFHRCALKQARKVGRTGRGETFMFHYNGLNLVHKHYRRGGVYSQFIKETYFYLDPARTRMWREFNLLRHMHQHGLPVPLPVAVRCYRRHFMTCRGDLITRQIEGTETLAERLMRGGLTRKLWEDVGATIRKFHDHEVNHADLNAHNILLDHKGKVFLIDFDKGRIGPSGKTSWKEANLVRLLRSLNKIQNSGAGLHFSQADWQWLLQGYEQYQPASGCLDARLL